MIIYTRLKSCPLQHHYVIRNLLLNFLLEIKAVTRIKKKSRS